MTTNSSPLPPRPKGPEIRPGEIISSINATHWCMWRDRELAIAARLEEIFNRENKRKAPFTQLNELIAELRGKK